jgi:hypothetical protein
MNQVVPSSINPPYAKKMHPNQYSQIQMPNYATRDIRASTGCSIVKIFFFFFGLAAIMFSCKANENANAGRLEEAPMQKKSNAKKAKILNIIGICLGSVVLLAIIIYYIVSSTKSTSSSSYSYYDYSYYD